MNTDFEDRFILRLETALSKRRRIAIETTDLKPAAVLVPIVFKNKDPHLILTKRTMTVARHKGQISFPGGVAEPTDASIVDTALRETHEEIGVPPKKVRVLGKLDDFETISGFLVTPVVGIVAADVVFHLDDAEVAELFETPLVAFQPPEIHELIKVDHEGELHEYHSYDLGQHVVWGATAGIIHRLLFIIEKRGGR